MQSDLENSIQTEISQALYRYIPASITGNLFVLISILFTHWNKSDHSLLWAASLILISLLGLLALNTLHYWKNHKKDSFSPRPWILKLVVLAGITGLFWGILFKLLLDESQPAYYIFNTSLLLGLMSGSVIVNSISRRVLLSFIIPLATPVFLHTIMRNNPLDFTISISFIVYIGIIISISNVHKKILISAIRFRLQNQNLIKQLIEEKNLAELAIIDKDRFIATASHDLRQPFNVQSLYINTLDKYIKPDGQAQLDLLRENHRSLSELLNNLLEIPRLSNNNIPINLLPIRLNDIITPLVNEYRMTIKSRDLKINGYCSKTIFLQTDPILLRRILINLLSNAVQYTHNGVIEVNCALVGDQIRVDISDTGKGIPERYINKIFNDYVQLSPSSDTYNKGLGLGLYIVKQLCLKLNIAISCSSTAGKGTKFTLLFAQPTTININENNLPCLNTTQSQEKKRPPLKTRKHLLLIEDDLRIVQAMKLLLSQWNYKVTTAISYSNATSKLEKLKGLDIIISDYHLDGGKGGIATTKKIQQDIGIAIPVIIITADTSIKNIPNKNLTIFYKPINPNDLYDRLITLLDD